jgi:hypothetical protein
MKSYNNQFATQKLREEEEELEEESVTGSGEGYLPKATTKKNEDKYSGYKEIKNFRPGHTKDKGGFQFKDLWDVNEEKLEELEENYSRFKNETKTRKAPEQFHQAVKQVKRKVLEINKIFEYMDRLKEELSEQNNGLKYRKYTENAIFNIKELTRELYKKSKKLK